MKEKTNVMRILEKQKIPYKSYYYNEKEAISGIEVAKVLDENPEQVFKTLVTISKNKKIYVFMIPVIEELDLKKAAKIVSEKSLEMLKQRDLLSYTGYIHGGCSPIGMVKDYPLVIHKSADQFSTIIFSAGKIGYQVEISVKNLLIYKKANLYDIIK